MGTRKTIHNIDGCGSTLVWLHACVKYFLSYDLQMNDSLMTSIFITSINHKRIRIIAAVKNDASKSMRHHGD